MENAIDAGSSQIDILVLEEAGLKTIQVINIMERGILTKMLKTFKRHAASKIHEIVTTFSEFVRLGFEEKHCLVLLLFQR